MTAAQPTLQSLILRRKLVIYLSCLNQGWIITICKGESPYDTQVTARTGMNTPAYATVVGQAALTFLSEKQLDALFKYRNL